MSEEKNVVDARISELRSLHDSIENTEVTTQDILDSIQSRILALESDRSSANDSVMQAVIRSHKAICKAKKMGERDAYGQDPAMYYTLGICGEGGELANNVVKALRNGWDKERVLEAVRGELPDVVIYSFILAYVLDIDLTQLVNEKVDVVVRRAESGYYGGEIVK